MIDRIAELVDLTSPYEYSAFHMLQAKPKQKAFSSAITETFTWPIWALILVSMVMVQLLRQFLWKFSAKHDSNAPKTKKPDAFFSFRMLIGHGEDLKANDLTLPVLILLGAWTVIAGFLIMAYTSTYFSLKVLPVFEVPVETVSELIKSDKKWFAYKDTANDDFRRFKPVGDRAIVKSWDDRINDFGNVLKGGGKMIRTLDRSVLVNSGFRQPNILQDFKDGKFYISREGLGEYWKAVALQYNSPLTKKVAPIVRRMFETGICTQASKIVEYESNLGEVSFEQMRMNQLMLRNVQRAVLELDHFAGAFILLGIGITISLAVFLLEKLIGKRIRF